MTEAQRAGTRALVLLCAAQFMVVLDTTIVTVALPAVGVELGFAGEAQLQYVVSLYALPFGALLLFGGRSADVLGRRRVFASGLAGFTAASLGCGLAASPVVLLAARVVQGAAAAFVSAAALALLTTVFAEGRARRRALGAWGAVGGAAGATGLLAGGALTDTFGWASVFLINVPIGVAAIASVPAVLPAVSRSATATDLPGALAVTTGLGALIGGLIWIEQHGLGPAPLALLVAGPALLATFARIEVRSRHPLLPPRLLRAPGPLVGNVAMLVLSGVVATALFFTTLYVQQVLGFSTLHTGLAFLPNSLLVLAGSALGSRHMRRVGPLAVLTAGLGVAAGGSLLLAATITVPGSYLTAVLPGFALNGLGLGVAFVAATAAATEAPSGDRGAAAGLVGTAQQIGMTLGLTTIVAVATTVASAAGEFGRPATEAVVEGYAAGHLTGAALATTAALLTGAAALRGRCHHRLPTPEEDPCHRPTPTDSP